MVEPIGIPPAPRKSVPPKNEIVPERLGIRIMNRLDTIQRVQSQLAGNMGSMRTSMDGMVMDQDTQGLHLDSIRSSTNAKVLWDWIRDVIIIILLVIMTSLIVWRGMRTEEGLTRCIQATQMSPVG